MKDSAASRGRRGRRMEAVSAAESSARLESLERRMMLANAVAAAVGQAHEHAEPVGFLPKQYNLTNRGGFLTKAEKGEPLDVALKYLKSNAKALGLTASDIAGAIVTDQYSDADTGVTHIYLRQTFNGLEVVNSDLGIHVTKDGKIASVGGGFVVGLKGTGSVKPKFSALTAVDRAASKLGIHVKTEPAVIEQKNNLARGTRLRHRELSLDDIPARLHYVPVEGGGVALAWNVELRTTDQEHWYTASVADGGTGELIFTSDWIDNESYNVLPRPTETPVDGPRAIVTNPFDPVASPFGWHDTNGAVGGEFTDTRGNNVFAQEDANADNTGGFRPDGGAALSFDFPLNLALAPSGYQSAAITNLFYWNNIIHDVTYKYGFTEAAGNFQFNNYGKGGLGNDQVQADAQDGSGTNNANFGTPPDGSSGRMQMYNFTATSPNRDGDFDDMIIVHEYGHGISNRLTGGPANASALNSIQSGGMGEGWSDWFGLMFTQKVTDTKTGSYPVGTYVLNNSGGIRRKPYAFDMAIDTLTWDAYGTSGTGGGVARSTEVHDSGEIWCSALWDLNWLLIDKYGFNSNVAAGYTGAGSAGNIVAMKLIMDAMKLQPANPSFIAARDAIVQADTILTGGQNQREIWTAFARRGLGFSASTASANATSVTIAFNLPPALLDPMVVSQLPATTQTSPVSAMSFTFNKEITTSSFSVASDVNSFLSPGGVNLLPQITGSSWSADSKTLTITFNAQNTNGLYSMSIGPNILAQVDGHAMNQDGDNSLGESVEDRYAGTFRVDTLPMAVTSTVPANNANVTLPFTTLDINLNEPVLASTIGVNDLTLSQGTVTAAAPLDADTIRYTLSGVTTEGLFTFTAPAASWTDNAGNPSNAYSGAFQLDVGTVAFPTPLASKKPEGSLVYAGTVAGNISFGGDVDSYTVALDAGQLINLYVDPAATLRPSIELRGTSGAVLATTLSGSAGLDVLIQNFVAPTTGTYTIGVSAGSGSGVFTLGLTLNGARETESHGLGGNDTRPSAQSLIPSFASFGGNASRAGVVGNIDTGGNNLPAEAEPNGSTAQANNAANNFTAFSGNLYHLGLSGSNGTASDHDYFNIGTLQAGDVLTITQNAQASSRGTLSDPLVYLYSGSAASPVLVTSNDDSGTGLDSMIYRLTIPVTDTYYVDAAVFSGTGSYQVGLWLEDDGNAPATGGALRVELEGNGSAALATNVSGSWRRVQYLSRTSGTISSSGDSDYFAYTFNTGDLVTIVGDSTGGQIQAALLNAAGTAIAADAGDSSAFPDSPQYAYVIPSAGTYYLRMQSPAGAVSYSADIYLSATTPPPVPVVLYDHYSFTLTTGESVSLVLNGATSDNVNLKLFSSGGSTIAVANASDNASQVINNFVSPAATTYYAAVSGAVGTEYTLAVVKNAEFDTEPNDSNATAQPVLSPKSGGVQRVLGNVGGTVSSVIGFDDLVGGNVDGAMVGGAMLRYTIGGQRSRGAVFAAVPPPAPGDSSEKGGAASGSPAQPTHLQGAAISGETSAKLALNFIEPVSAVSFDLAFPDALQAPDALLKLMTEGGEIVATLNTFETLAFSSAAQWEGSLAYQGEPITHAELVFTGGQPARFMLDNLQLTGNAVDRYKISLGAGDTLIASTATPGDGPGEPQNTLNPRLRIFDAAGVDLAGDDDAAADGRNALVNFVAPAAGTYYVEVSSTTAANTVGDYVLSLTGNTATNPPFAVAASDPANGAQLLTAPTQMRIDFNDGILATTLAASDLKINGVSATAVTQLDSDSALFTLPPLTGSSWTATIAAGAVLDIQSTPIQAFSSQFEIDVTAPRVIGSSLQQGATVAPGDLTYTVQFSEPMLTVNLDELDFSLVGQFAASSYLPLNAEFNPAGTQLMLQFSGLPQDNYTLTLISGTGAFEDLAGNDLDGEPVAFPIPPNQSGNGAAGGDFVLNFQADIGTQAYPTPLAGKQPRGGMIYDPSVSGLIGAAGDVDSFTIALDAGQTLSLVVDASATLSPTLELRDPSNAVIASAIAAGAGKDALLQTVAITTAGTYTVAVGSAGGTSGAFELNLVLNAAVEAQNHDAAENDSRASAQNINASFLALTDRASRGAVLGSAGTATVIDETDAYLPSPDFYSFTAAPTDRVTVGLKGLGAGELHVVLQDSAGNALASGAASATNLTEVIANFQIPSAGTYYIEVTGDAGANYSVVATKNAAFDQESNGAAAPQSLAGQRAALGAIAAGVQVPEGSGPTVLDVDVSGTPLSLGIAVDGSFVGPNIGASWNGVEFLRYGTFLAGFTVALDGVNYTNELAAGQGSAFPVTLTDISSGSLHAVRAVGQVTTGVGFERVIYWNDGDSFALVTTKLNNNTGAPIGNVALVDNQDPDPGGTFETANDVAGGLAIGSVVGIGAMALGSSDARAVVSAEGFYVVNPFDVINSPEDPNGSQGDIALNVAFDLDTLGSGESTSATFVMVFGGSAASVQTTYEGIASKTNGAENDDDYYSIPLAAGQQLRVRTKTPGDGPGEFNNNLDPMLTLYSAGGAELAIDDNSAADGRNAELLYTATAAGTYKLRVSGAEHSSGEYILELAGTPQANDDSAVVNEDDSVTIDVRANDVDPDGLGLTITQAGPASNGSVVINADNTVTYTPAADFFGEDSFTYTATSASGSTSTATVNVTVTPVADAPVVTASDAGGDEGSAIALTVSAAPSDVDDSDTLELTIEGVPAGASLNHGTDLGGGNWKLTPADLAGLTITCDDNGVFELTVRAVATETASGTTAQTTAPLQLTVGNVEPELGALEISDDSIEENDSVTVSGSYTDASASDTHTVMIDWGDGSTPTAATIDPLTRTFTAVHQFLDDDVDDSYGIVVTVEDDDGGVDSDAIGVTVANVPPVAAPITGPASGVRGQSLGFAASFTDVGSLDTHEVSWDFGNGVVIPFHSAADAGALSGAMTYTAGGTYTVKFTVRDDDGGVKTVSKQVQIKAAELQGNDLYIGGTTGADMIHVNESSSQGYKLQIGGVVQGYFNPTGRIIIYGQAGNDSITVSRGIVLPTELYGGDGNDTMNGGGGNDLLLGGIGSDSLNSDSGRDILIGGVGGDTLTGNSEDDILIAGTTAHDNDPVALRAILSEWTRGDKAYAGRVSSITSGGGLNGAYTLSAANVFNDAHRDLLQGASGSDWFFRFSNGSAISDIVEGGVGEIITELT